MSAEKCVPEHTCIVSFYRSSEMLYGNQKRFNQDGPYGLNNIDNKRQVDSHVSVQLCSVQVFTLTRNIHDGVFRSSEPLDKISRRCGEHFFSRCRTLFEHYSEKYLNSVCAVVSINDCIDYGAPIGRKASNSFHVMGLA